MQILKPYHILFIIITNYFSTSICFSQTLPAMVYDLKNSDIEVIEVSEDIAVMYGGIGKPERDLIEKLGKNYNIKLVFIALPWNKYLSNVEVNIINEKGQKIVRVRSQGPFFYAKVPSGIFTVKAVYEGKLKTYKNVKITQGVKRLLYFRWNIKKTIN